MFCFYPYHSLWWVLFYTSSRQWICSTHISENLAKQDSCSLQSVSEEAPRQVVPDAVYFEAISGPFFSTNSHLQLVATFYVYDV